MTVSPWGIAQAVSGGTVVVPPGLYRIDGTVILDSDMELRLIQGAVLKRVNLAADTGPIVILSGMQNVLSGGLFKTMNPSPRSGLPRGG